MNFEKEKLILKKAELLKEKIKIEEDMENLDTKLKELEENEEENIFLKNAKENIDEVKEIRQLLYLYDKYEKKATYCNHECKTCATNEICEFFNEWENGYSLKKGIEKLDEIIKKCETN